MIRDRRPRQRRLSAARDGRTLRTAPCARRRSPCTGKGPATRPRARSRLRMPAEVLQRAPSGQGFRRAGAGITRAASFGEATSPRKSEEGRFHMRQRGGGLPELASDSDGTGERASDGRRFCAHRVPRRSLAKPGRGRGGLVAGRLSEQGDRRYRWWRRSATSANRSRDPPPGREDQRTNVVRRHQPRRSSGLNDSKYRESCSRGFPCSITMRSYSCACFW